MRSSHGWSSIFPLHILLILRSSGWRFLFSLDGCYDALKRLFFLRWSLCCLGTDYRNVIVIQTSILLCSLDCFSFVDLLVTKIENGQLRIASIMSYASRNHWGTRMLSWLKYRWSFILGGYMVKFINWGWSSFCLLTRAVFECVKVDSWPSFVLKRVFMSAFCVSSSEKTALDATTCGFTIAIGADFRTATFSSLPRKASMCWAMKTVPKSTTIAKFFTTISRGLVSWLVTLIYGVTLALVLSRSFDADVSDVGTSSYIFDNQSMGMKSLQINLVGILYQEDSLRGA